MDLMMDPRQVHETLGRYILIDGLPVVADLKKSKGSWLVDHATGQRYLDCYSMHAAMPLGWNHSGMWEQQHRMTDVMFHNVSNSDMYTTQYAEFAETFSRFTPDFKHYFFVAGGTLAVENALKAAFDYKAQKLGWDDYYDYDHENKLDVIHLEHAFHGRSGYTLSLTNTGVLKTKWYPQFKWTRIIAPAFQEGQYSTCEDISLEQAKIALKGGKVAAIILETIQGEGGDNYFSNHFFQELRKLADEYDAMLILDEVQTGMGLTGKTWAYEHYGIIPDMISFGKKTQVCGFCSTGRIDQVPTNVFNVPGRINSTWGGNLVDMVRSTIYMEIIEKERLIQNATNIGLYFFARLQELGLKNLRGLGLMIAFDMPTAEKRNEFYTKLSEKMLCLKCGLKSIRFRPHLTFSKEDADTAFDIVKSAL
jgi:L-lysine 6-transaminase